MSETMKDKNIPNPNEENNGAEPAKAGAQQDGKKGEQDKQFFLVRWGKAVVAKAKDAVDAVKEHPVLVAVSAALGTAAGGYVTYRAMSHVAATSAETDNEPAMLPSGEESTDETDTEETVPDVEYVDVK